jgi:hypothetical protein
MAVTLVMEFKGMTREKYDAIMRELGLDKQNAQWPKGIISHVAGPLPDGWGVVDIWESQAAFDNFLSNQLTPAFTKVGGIPKPEPRVFTVSNSYGVQIPVTR